MRGIILSLVCASIFLTSPALAQTPIKLTVDANSHEFAIPADFVGLGFETKSVVPNQYGVSGYFFTAANTQLITLFQNIGLKNIRVGGGTVDGSGTNEHCVTPTPSHRDIDNLFEFSRAAGVKVIYSVRLENLGVCPNPNLASEDASIAQYVWNKHRADLDSLSIGNEPDVREFHTYPGHQEDPSVYESTPGVPGSAYASYFADWRKFADVILKSVPEAKFSGPDTAVSDKGTFVPNPSSGVSWTEQFADDLKKSGILVEALQHHYVWGGPGNTTAQEAIDDMLSSAWDNGTSIGTQPAHNGGTAEFHPYPYLYTNVLAPLVSSGMPYRMTEANDCLHGVVGASNGFASALWSLDYMHWWAAHHMAGVNFHNNPWIPTDTIVPEPNPCPPSGCGNYRITPKGYGMKAFALGSHGYVKPVAILNPEKMNLTAYAAGTMQDLYITIINKTHTSTKDATDADVVIQADGFESGSAGYMVLTDGDPGNAASMTATLGGASITNDARWQGKWTPLGPVTNGKVSMTVQSTTAVVVKLHAAGAYAGPIQINQNGALEIFGTAANGNIWHTSQRFIDSPSSQSWSNWTELNGGIASSGGTAVVRNEDNTLEVFAPSKLGGVYHNKQITPGGLWTGWSKLAEDQMTDLVAAANADGSISLFGIGANGDVWTNSQSAPGVGWSAWKDLGAQKIQPGFVIGQTPSGYLEVFGVDPNGSVWYNRQTEDGSWSGWTSLEGKVEPQLAIGRNLDGRLELFGIGTNGHVVHNLQQTPGGTWAGWSDLSGEKIEPGFVVGQYKDGRLVIFGVSTRSHNASTGSGDSHANREVPKVWTASQKIPGGPYGDWNKIGAMDLSQFVVGNTGYGSLQLFGIDKDKSVWSARQTTPVSDLSGWTRLSGQRFNFYSHQILARSRGKSAVSKGRDFSPAGNAIK
jgi:hypothetical protein